MAIKSADSWKTGPCFLDSACKVVSLDELGHDEAQPVAGTSHVMHRNDVGMVEVRNDSGLGQVSFDIFRARDSLGAWDFDRNRSVEVFVVGEKHLAEAALPRRLSRL